MPIAFPAATASSKISGSRYQLFSLIGYRVAGVGDVVAGVIAYFATGAEQGEGGSMADYGAGHWYAL